MKQAHHNHRPSTQTPTHARAEIADLWAEHYDSTVRVAQRILRRRDLAEEAAQQAFLKYLERRCTPEPGKEGAYLRRMAANLALTSVRRQHLEYRHMQTFEATSESAETHALRQVESERMRDHIDALPQQQRMAIVCQHVAGLSERETATSLGVSPGAIKTHRHRARAALREAYQQAA